MIYPLNFPSQAPTSERLILNRRQAVSVSEYTGGKEVVEHGGQWALEWTWPPVAFEEAEALSAWLLSLKGQAGSFRYSPRQRYLYEVTGITLATTAFSYNDTIRLRGYAANSATGLRLGQYMTIGSQLLRIVEAGAFADGSGAVTVSFAPDLRLNYPTGTVVNLSAPFGVFSLASSEGAGYTIDPNKLPEFGTLQAVELV